MLKSDRNIEDGGQIFNNYIKYSKDPLKIKFEKLKESLFFIKTLPFAVRPSTKNYILMLSHGIVELNNPLECVQILLIPKESKIINNFFFLSINFEMK